jgi:hypothetical protein
MFKRKHNSRNHPVNSGGNSLNILGLEREKNILGLRLKIKLGTWLKW